MLKKVYDSKKFLLIVGVFAVCGIMLTGVDDCEEEYYEEYVLADSGQNVSQGTDKSGAQAGTQADQSGTSGAVKSQASSSASQTQKQASGSAAQTSGAAKTQPAGSGTAASNASASSPPKTQPASTGSQSGQAGTSQTQQSNTPVSTGSQSSAQTGQPVASPTGAAPAALSSISGKNWKLVEVKKDSSVIAINRQKLEADGFGDLFTIAFGDRISGRGAPNRFTAPYQTGANNALTIQQPASTMMAAIYDPERIHEKDYFQYLTGVKSWKVNQNRLELYSSDSAGKETVLVYDN
jgi:heat shock protein HslJ